MKLSELFERCLNITYIRAENNADYATDRRGDTLYIYFEKTADNVDWKNNFDFPVKAYKRMNGAKWYVHRGFLKVWRSLEKYIAPPVADETVRKVIVVGYSHGAALALLCHEYVWFNRPDLRDSLLGYGFGCPRVVWGFLPRCVKKRWQNFTVLRNVPDIVTHLPPALFGFRHVGKMIKTGEYGKYSPVDAHRPENILEQLTASERFIL